MWLVALGRLVLLVVRPMLLMCCFVSFGARPLRHLSANRPPHFSTHLVPPVAMEVPRRPVVQLVLHAPDAMESLSNSGALELGVLHLVAFVAHLSPENIQSESPSRGCHLPQTSPATLHITTWIEVSTCEVLDLARARSLQTAKSHFGSSSGTVDNTPSGHPRLVENVPTAKLRVGSLIAQLDDPLVFPHHTSFPDIA